MYGIVCMGDRWVYEKEKITDHNSWERVVSGNLVIVGDFLLFVLPEDS